jgi:putative pyruvate formate lyase activating enzyme
LKAEDYSKAARAFTKEMHRQVGDLILDENGLAKRGVLLHHLVIPNRLEDAENIMEFLAKEISPNTYVNIMDQYFPSRKVSEKNIRKSIDAPVQTNLKP